MIRRIEYANDAWTRTAAVVKHNGPRGWCLHRGGTIAEIEAYVTYHRTMQQAQAAARIWIARGTPMPNPNPTLPMYVVWCEWENGEQTGPEAIFTGPDAQVRAERYAEQYRQRLAHPTDGSRPQTVYAHDDDDNDNDEWTVDVHADPVRPADIDPQEPPHVD